MHRNHCTPRDDDVPPGHTLPSESESESVSHVQDDPQQAYLPAGQVGTELTGIFTGLVCVVIGVELVLLACIYCIGHTSYVSGLDVVR